MSHRLECGMPISGVKMAVVVQVSESIPSRIMEWLCGLVSVSMCVCVCVCVYVRVYLIHSRLVSGRSVKMVAARDSVLLAHSAPCSFRPSDREIM